jgi:hypothetical protein
MRHDFVEMYRKALELKNAGKVVEAAELSPSSSTNNRIGNTGMHFIILLSATRTWAVLNWRKSFIELPSTLSRATTSFWVGLSPFCTCTARLEFAKARPHQLARIKQPLLYST